MTSNQKLDEVLISLNNAYIKSRTSVVTKDNEGVICTTAPNPLARWVKHTDIHIDILIRVKDADIIDLDLVLDYLAENKFINCLDNPRDVKSYDIRFEGRVLLEDGGFMGNAKSSKKKLEDDDYHRLHSESLANRLNYLTAILSVGSLALAISEGIKIYTEHSEYFCLYLKIVALIASVVALTLYTNKTRQQSLSSS